MFGGHAAVGQFNAPFTIWFPFSDAQSEGPARNLQHGFNMDTPHLPEGELDLDRGLRAACYRPSLLCFPAFGGSARSSRKASGRFLVV